MNNDISRQVFEKIGQEHIKPLPRWSFLLKNYFFWGAFALSVIIGSLGVSVAIYFLRYNDWDLHEQIAVGQIGLIARTFPYFWLVFFAAFVGLAYYNFRHTKNSYRSYYYLIPALSIVLSLLGGLAIHRLEMSERIEREVSYLIPGYRGMTEHMRLIWQQPERGLISGTIFELGDGTYVYLTDLNDYDWRVNIGQAKIAPGVDMAIDERIKVIGQIKAESMFEAREVRPFAGQCFHHLRGEPCPMKDCTIDRISR